MQQHSSCVSAMLPIPDTSTHKPNMHVDIW